MEEGIRPPVGAARATPPRRAQARELGTRIIEAERHLNQRFAAGHIDEASLREATAGIAELYGRLRFAHLHAHLQVTALLGPAQIEAYDRLRGYRGAAEPRP